MFENVPLFEWSYKYLIDFFNSIDNNLTVDITGVTFEKIGIAIYAPEAFDDTSLKVQFIFIYRKDYDE